MPADLDAIDHAILELLREDARRTVADIAGRVNLTAAPVKRRIDRMERLGVIAGYTVIVDDGKVGPTLEAFTELRFAPGHDMEAVMRGAAALPGVREALTTAGDPDAILHLQVSDADELKAVVGALRRTGHFIGTKTLMVLERWTPGG